MTNKTNGKLLTMNQAAEFLKISKPTVYRLLEQGKIKGMKAGNQWRFQQSDLSEYLDRGPLANAFADVPIDLANKEIAYFTGQLKQLGRESTVELSALPTQEELMGRLASDIVVFALISRASDIHLEAFYEDKNPFYLLRLRVDGVMHEARKIPRAVGEGILTCFKTWMVMPLDSRLPMDGRIKMQADGRSFDIRGSLIPTIFGTSAVFRILDAQSITLGLDKIGMATEDIKRMRGWIKRSHGLILVTGATGSGKTTLIYSMLQELANAKLKTMTVESPVELALPWTTQMQVKPEIGFTFPAAIRAALRQDPDIIMIAEIRDKETLNLALQAALTGHLVISVLHTPDATSALSLMAEMGVEPFLISSALIGIVATRLVRKICAECGKPAASPDGALALKVTQAEAKTGFKCPKKANFLSGAGCSVCNSTGYKGQIGLYEAFEFSNDLKTAFLKGVSGDNLQDVARLAGMIPLLGDGLRKVTEGKVSFEEIFRVFSDLETKAE
ncbi:MAG: Flp pilus assembly complex ATPase component TadA [Candidatus Riflebacteria bacterium]|nr:Flp pilus assembly complex ATPase component TadA [Candidatus Riflebacteria bacterium]